MGTLNEQIENFVDACLSDSSFFLVDLYISNNQRKVEVSLDGDSGVTIEKCAEVSKKLGAFIEEENLIGHAYQLYVSSPGVDTPIKNPRQFNSRLGREFSVLMNDGTKYKGVLNAIIEGELELEIEQKEKGKKKVIRQIVRLPSDKIDQAVVKLSFK